MTSSHQQMYDTAFAGVPSSKFVNRADLLSGLRTSSASNLSFSGQNNHHDGYYHQNDATHLNVGAAVFTPNSLPPRLQAARNQSDNRQPIRDAAAMPASLEDQLAVMQLQAALVNQGSMYNNPVSAQQQQQQQIHQQFQQQLIQQQALVRQQQLELLRLQALQQHQQQQQQVSAQQRFLLAQIHSEYERQSSAAQTANLEMHQQQQQHQALVNAAQLAASAQEQRQAAQASIQASLRQRQAQQAYQQQLLMDSDHANRAVETEDDQLQQHMARLTKQLQLPHARNQSEGHTRAAASMASEREPSPPLNRMGSPNILHLLQQGRRERTTSGTAESVASWRSRTVTPSIVIDDSASEGSRSAAVSFDGDGVERDQTPETSEEDLDISTPLEKMLLTKSKLTASSETKYGKLGKGVTTPTMGPSPAIQAPKAIPRAISLAAAPRTRAFTNEHKAVGQTINNANLTLPAIQPRRQPKGQPNDFKEVNFQARMNSRTRKDAMSKLCASPRAASFGGNALGFGSRIVSASS